jgi:transcriptional regulator with XRE-family HTH domain
MPDRFGDKLRYLRHRHTLTQTDLARWLVLVSQSHISQLESHHKTPSLEVVLRVADVFGITTDYLLRDTIPPDLDTLPEAHPATAEDMPPQVQCLGAKLAALRRQRGWTQTEVARRLAPITQAHISFLEAGRKAPSPGMVLQLADVFGVTTEYLLRDRVPVAEEE